MDFECIAKCAKEAALKIASLSSDTKNKALLNIANEIEQNKTAIFEANNEDLKLAQKLLETGELTKSTYNRLKLDENKMRDMIKGIKDVAALEDPINKKLLSRELDEGLTLYKVSCPIGVLGIIFEARPDVISQISALAIKSANAVILKGGKESVNTNKKILEIINTALDKTPMFPQNVIQQVFTRDDVAQMLKCDKYINLIIPRGGNKLVKYIKENTKISVLGHADGICHIYADKSADYDMAVKIITDAKTQYPSACNSVETLLINKDFPKIDELLAALQLSDITLVDKPDNWAFEYGDKTLSFKIVSGLDEAIAHINKYGSGHTDCIITENLENAQKFMNEVDSAGVYHNVSTRFADGFRYGFGAEVGISTTKASIRSTIYLLAADFLIDFLFYII